jgi:hypothetical protein
MAVTQAGKPQAVNALAGAVKLTDGATIATDCSQGLTFAVTIAGNRTLSAPTKIRPGVPYRWAITQDATGSRGLTLDAAFVMASGLTWAPTATAGKTDIIGGIGDPSGANRILVTTIAKGF